MRGVTEVWALLARVPVTGSNIACKGAREAAKECSTEHLSAARAHAARFRRQTEPLRGAQESVREVSGFASGQAHCAVVREEQCSTHWGVASRPPPLSS
jgi:hypothetical protein